MVGPTLDQQSEFWDHWNHHLRTSGVDDPFMQAQLRFALSLARDGDPGQRILDVGCGTGWLGGSLAPWGKVTGVDLSPKAIEVAQATWPGVRFVAGDFEAIDPGEEFDLVVSADVIAHVADQPAFIQKVGGLMRPGGLFLLMTQNRTVWNHSRSLSAQDPGQLRDWPRLASLRRWLADDFSVERVTSIVPGGNTGVFRLVNNHYLVDAARAVGAEDAWVRAREGARIGRELVIIARRR